ncbi:MAG TPA: hypothetical protein VG722_10315, partial [Tepidisphaeraceae bacterium]|nr:hypothetical protein [Tepidisphaeraceae bacterium]
MSKANPSQGPGLNKFDSRWRLLSLWGVVFFATFFFYAHTDPIDIFYHLIVDGFFLTVWLISAWGFGRWIVGKGNSLLIHLSRIAIGLGVMSILILLLGLAGWFRDISALLLLALGFLLAISDLANRHHLRKTKWNDTVRQWFAKSAGCHWLLILLAPFAGLMFAGGLVMPGLLWGLDDPSGYDVVEYHLQVPREWFEAGRIIPLHHNVFSFFPFNV